MRLQLIQNKGFVNKLLKDSHFLFMRTFLLTYAISIFLYQQSRLYLSFVILISSALFIFYSKVRYAHYKRSFREKKFIIGYIIEVSILLIGMVYNLIFQFFFAKGNEINIVFCLTLAIFTFPTLIGTMRIKEFEKNKRI